MGRPIRNDVIEGMNLTVDGEKLLRQVGYNKYVTDKDRVVRLAAEKVDENDVVLKVDGKIVTKILKNIMTTTDGIIVYKLAEDGSIVVLNSSSSVDDADTNDSETSEESSEETVTEETVETNDESNVEESSEESVENAEEVAE